MTTITKPDHPKFKAERFKPTEFDTAAQKAKFANHLITFLLAGFPESKFPKWFYRRLSMTFGHIAHTSQNGFYGHFFVTQEGRLEFVKSLLEGGGYGDPAFTYSDVERAVRAWVSENLEGIGVVLAELAQKDETAANAEASRVDALRGQSHQEFKIIAKSDNIGAFGHYQYVLLARDGTTYKVQRSSMFTDWERGMTLRIPLRNGQPTWDGLNVECPDRCKNAPADVLKQIWG